VRFQQLSAPTAAKSVEDTAFYRYGVLLSRNEVGSDPARFASRPEDFHAACAARLEAFPRALLATATHDHKRGEDVRARLAVVSEWPEAWATLVEAVETVLPAASVDPGDRLMLLQMLVGAWPAVLGRGDEAGIAAFRERIGGWQQKALREAKLRTDWAAPDLDYEAACRADLAALLAPGAAREAVAAFVARLMVPGMINALSQSFLRLTTPGIPDLYQGAALWDESLVDPDNRRVPDFTALRDLARREPPPVAEWRSGAVKLAMIARVLRLRRETLGVLADGGYEPVMVEGPRAGHVVAFVRSDGPSRHARDASAGDPARGVAGHQACVACWNTGQGASDGPGTGSGDHTGGVVRALAGRPCSAELTRHSTRCPTPMRPSMGTAMTDGLRASAGAASGRGGLALANSPARLWRLPPRGLVGRAIWGFSLAVLGLRRLNLRTGGSIWLGLWVGESPRRG
jgi:hypothetical protein